MRGFGFTSVCIKSDASCFSAVLCECRAVNGFSSNKLHDWLKNSRHFFSQSEVKPKQIVTCFHSFFRAKGQLHVFIGSLCYLYPFDRLE